MKAKTYASLKRAADKVFSEWIRASYPAHCVTCGASHPRKRLQCGHFVSRVHLATRYEPINCAPQCYACNVLRRGNPAEFANWLIAKYGQEVIPLLVGMKNKSVKYTRADLLQLIVLYKGKLAEL